MSASYNSPSQLAYQQAANIARQDISRQQMPRVGEIRALAEQGLGLIPDDERLPLEVAFLKARLSQMRAWADMVDPAVDRRAKPALMRDALLIGYSAVDAAMNGAPESAKDPRALFMRGLLAGQVGFMEAALSRDIFSSPTAWSAYTSKRDHKKAAQEFLELSVKDLSQVDTEPSLLPLAETRARLGLVTRLRGGFMNNMSALGEFDQIGRDVKGFEERHGRSISPGYAEWIAKLVMNTRGQEDGPINQLPYGVVVAPSFEPSPYEPGMNDRDVA